jgi:hypothetical protein
MPANDVSSRKEICRLRRSYKNTRKQSVSREILCGVCLRARPARWTMTCLQQPNKEQIMVWKSRIAPGIVIVLGAASTAMAATKHQVHRHRAAVETSDAYGYLNGSNVSPGAEPAYMAIQSEDFNRQY